jgi:murein DD-endopeptidase MepM/ murein hydrolase activator NlpD
VVSGDTLSGIAAAAGVSTQSVFDANGLDGSSIIFPGQSIVIPGPASAPAAAVAPTPAPAPAPAPALEPAVVVAPARATVAAGQIAELTDEMRANAATIVAVGRSLGVSDQGLVVALAAAAQESGLVNVAYGDRDSLGLFQQRPSTGWGTAEEVQDPTRASYAFFGGPTNPNAGRTRGLLDIAGWETLTVTQAAQAVQISAFPDEYAKWEASARAWLPQVG